MNTTDTTTQATGTERANCTCGCDQLVKSSKARYIPGHDAAHVSKLVAVFVELVGQDTTWHEIDETRSLHLDLEAQLPTDALKAKFNRAIHNRMNKDFDRWAARENRADAIKDEARREAAHKANTIWFGFHPDDYAASFKG